MSWIESHQSLLTHRKTLRASAILKVSKFQIIGHMHALWWWGLDNAEDNGCLGDILPEELAEAAGWPARKAVAFMAALESVRFIEKTDCGYQLHNWWNYAGKLNDKRAKDRERKAEGRANSEGLPAEVAGTSQAPTNQPTVPTDPPNLTNPLLAAAKGVWENRIGVLPPTFREEFAEVVERTPAEWFATAVEVTRAEADHPNWKFCRSVIETALAANTPPRLSSEKPPMPTTLAEIRSRSKVGARR